MPIWTSLRALARHPRRIRDVGEPGAGHPARVARPFGVRRSQPLRRSLTAAALSALTLLAMLAGTPVHAHQLQPLEFAFITVTPYGVAGLDVFWVFIDPHEQTEQIDVSYWPSSEGDDLSNASTPIMIPFTDPGTGDDVVRQTLIENLTPWEEYWVQVTIRLEEGVNRNIQTLATPRLDIEPHEQKNSDNEKVPAESNSSGRGLWSDGTTMWISDVQDKRLYAYSLEDGTYDSSKNIKLGSRVSPGGIWSDGTTLWVSNGYDTLTTGADIGFELFAYDLSDGARQADKDFFVGNRPADGIWSDGTTMWAVQSTYNSRLSRLTALSLDSGTPQPDKGFSDLYLTMLKPSGIASHGGTMWLSDEDDRGKLYAFDLATFNRIEDLDIDLVGSNTRLSSSDLWTDGDTMWVLQSSGKVFSYQMPTEPSAPRNLAASPTVDTLNLTWARPADDGGPPVRAYEVQYRASSASGWTDVDRSTNPTALTQSIDQLTSGTSYNLRVRARNAAGPSSYTTITASTASRPRAITEPGVPRALAASGDGALTLTWSEPADDGGSAVTGYEVQYRVRNTSVWTDASRPSNSTVPSQTIPELTNDTAYELRVRARNLVGPGDYATITATPAAAGVTGAPGVPRALAAFGDGALTLTWLEPADDGDSAVTGYEVQYRDSNTSVWTDADRPSNSTVPSQTIPDLTNGTVYDLRVRARNLAGAGDYATITATPAAVIEPGGSTETPTGTPTAAPTTQDTQEERPERFEDVEDGTVHAANIYALYAAGVTSGCATVPLRYCPENPVTRAQMATFLTRALDLDIPDPDDFAEFTDVSDDSVHTPNINALHAAGITSGCATDPLRYCPDDPVTRAQMATFLTRALDLDIPDPDDFAGFTDVSDDSVHTPNIYALRAAAVTSGCATDPLRYCPDDSVTRAQMATFLTRALDLPPAG